MVKDNLSDLKIIQHIGVDKSDSSVIGIFVWNFPEKSAASMEDISELINSFLFFYKDVKYSLLILNDRRITSGLASLLFVYKLYKAISSAHQENIKRCYVLHATWPIRLSSFLMNLLDRNFISKTLYITCFHELYEHIPTRLSDIPQEVLMYDKELEQKVYGDVTGGYPYMDTNTFIFNRSLESFFGKEDEMSVPVFIESCLSNIKERGYTMEGILRISADQNDLRNLCFHITEDYDFSTTNPYVAGDFLKKFLRSLTEPLLGHESWTYIHLFQSLPLHNRCASLRDFLRKLKACHVVLLKRICEMCDLIEAHKRLSLMTYGNLAVVLTPNMTWGDSDLENVVSDSMKSLELVKFIFQNHQSLI